MKAPRKHPEQDLQKAVAEFLERILPDDAVFTAINPMPFKKKAAAGISKAMGARKGFPDLHILWRCQAYYIEIKSKDGRVDRDQMEVIIALSNAGGRCAVCHSIEAVYGHLLEWGIPLKGRLAA